MKQYPGKSFEWVISIFLRMKEQKGATLPELTIVVAIVGAMTGALGFSFDGWASAYRIESITKEIYSDLMDARVRAMQRNRTHFVALSDTGYSVFDDSHPAPDGNNDLEPAEDTLVSGKELDKRYPITWSGIADKTIAFTHRGLSNDNKTICLFSESNPDYDCIEISRTRINIGKLLKQPAEGGRCISENCASR